MMHFDDIAKQEIQQARRSDRRVTDESIANFMTLQIQKFIIPKDSEEEWKRQPQALFTEVEDRFRAFSNSTISEHFAKQPPARAVQMPRSESANELACRSKRHAEVHKSGRGGAIRTTGRCRDNLPFDQHPLWTLVRYKPVFGMLIADHSPSVFSILLS
jgi:hypothetical protein